MRRSGPGLLISVLALAAAFLFAPAGAPNELAARSADPPIVAVALDFARPASVACRVLEQAPFAPLRHWSRELLKILNAFEDQKPAEAADCRIVRRKTVDRMPG